MARKCIDVIVKQLTPCVRFWISDNSSLYQSFLYLADYSCQVDVVRRGGSLGQFQHMSAVFEELTAEYAVLMHDDDMFSPYFINMMTSYASGRPAFGLLLNRVKSIKHPCDPNDLNYFSKYQYLSLKCSSKTRIIDDYLLGCVRGEYYSISMTLFNVNAARRFLPVLVGNGIYADALFILAIAHEFKYILNTTPSGFYYLGPTSISHSSRPIDVRKFAFFLLQHPFYSRFREKIAFYKFRHRINFIGMYNAKPRAIWMLVKTFFRYLALPGFAFYIYLALLRRIATLACRGLPRFKI